MIFNNLVVVKKRSTLRVYSSKALVAQSITLKKLHANEDDLGLYGQEIKRTG